MSKRLIIITVIGLCLVGCASRLAYTPEIRKESCADNRLFSDMLNGIGGVGFADEVLYPNAKERRIVKIEVGVPYDNKRTGIEHWTIQHDGAAACSYIVKFIPDGVGGTRFTIQRDSETNFPFSKFASLMKRESDYRKRAEEFIQYAQTGELEKMLGISFLAARTNSIRTEYEEQVIPQFHGAVINLNADSKVVTWHFNGSTNLDASDSLGIMFSGTAVGPKMFSFVVCVIEENEKLMVVYKKHG